MAAGDITIGIAARTALLVKIKAIDDGKFPSPEQKIRELADVLEDVITAVEVTG